MISFPPFGIIIFKSSLQYTVVTCTITEASRVVHGTNLSIAQVCDFVDMLSLLVICNDPVNRVEEGESRLFAVHCVTPNLFVNFAHHSRVYSGLHLLKWAVCHSADPPLMPDFMNSQLQIGIYDGAHYFNIHGQVWVSMKKENHHTCVHSLAKPSDSTVV